MLVFGCEEVEGKEKETYSVKHLKGIEALSGLLDDKVADDEDNMIDKSVDDSDVTCLGSFELRKVGQREEFHEEKKSEGLDWDGTRERRGKDGFL